MIRTPGAASPGKPPALHEPRPDAYLGLYVERPWNGDGAMGAAPTVPTLSAHGRRALAVEACVCPRTVDKYLAGESVRSTCSARIAAALDRLGLASRKGAQPRR
jgi:hypothetical protein